MEPRMTIAPIQDDEAPDWGEMRLRLWPDCTPADNARDVADFRSGASALRLVLMARMDGLAAGFAEVSERNVVDGAGNAPAAYLEGWYVEPQFRGRGVGGALVAAAAAWARQAGFGFLGSDAELHNSASQRAHEALGFQDQGRVVNYLMVLQ